MTTPPKTSKREALKDTQARQAREAKVRRTVLAVVGGILLLLIIAAVALAVKGHSDASKPTPASSPAAVKPLYLTSDDSFRILAGGSVDKQADDSAKPDKQRVEVFFDPMCPGCGAMERSLGSYYLDLVKQGSIDLYVNPTAFLDSKSKDRYSTRSVNALVTVFSEAPEQGYAFLSELYKQENQPHEASEYIPVTDDDLARWAVNVGVPQTVADKFKEHKYVDWVKYHTSTTTSRSDLFSQGFSTPTVVVGGHVENGKVVNSSTVQFTNNSTPKQTFDKALADAKGKK